MTEVLPAAKHGHSRESFTDEDVISIEDTYRETAAVLGGDF
jgi:hypothetical protein